MKNTARNTAGKINESDGIIKMKLDLTTHCKIDSEELKVALENIQDMNEIDEDRKPFMKFKGIDRQGNARLMLHMSRQHGRYDSNNYSYSKQMKGKSEMLKDLGVLVLNEVSLNRVDICFDYGLEYMDMYKLNDCMMGLYGLEYKEQEAVDISDKRKRKPTSMRCSPRHQQLYIYDKKHESKGMHLYNTRVEFRFKDVRVDEKTKIKDLSKLLDRLIVNFEAFEKQRADDLYEWYREDVASGVVRNFSEFVRHNDRFITTTGICEALHSKVGLKGSYKKWLNKYRQTNSIEFITKTDIKTMIAEMKKAIKTYMKA